MKHIDLVGTILLPGFLLLLHSPFLFGYAKRSGAIVAIPILSGLHHHYVRI